MLDLKYVSLFGSLLYEYSKLNYTAAGFNNLGKWADVKEEIEYKKTALEISLLLNMDQILSRGGGRNSKNDLMLQIGYGRTFDEVTGGGNYLLFGAKKLMF